MLRQQNAANFKLSINLGALAAVCICFFVAYTTIFSPVARVPMSYILDQTPPIPLDSSIPTTRGSMEARLSHKSHDASLPVSHAQILVNGIPAKYTSSKSGLPLANYAVMIDAGSSGSRVYVYQYKLPFSTTGASPDPSADLLHVAVAEDANHTPIVRKQEPGLSAFGASPERAFASIEPLLEFAANHIPVLAHKTTPIYVLATAGLRMLPDSQRAAVLANVRAGLRRWSAKGQFVFESDNQADVITGEDEGLFGWVALNYVRNRFGDLAQTYPTGGLDPHTHRVLPRVSAHEHHMLKLRGDNRAMIVDPPNAPPRAGATVGLLEIGGGSAQIAFEASMVSHNNDGAASEHPSDYIYRLDLDLTSCSPAIEKVSSDGPYVKGGHQYSVYTASLLGYGVNAARARYVKTLLAGKMPVEGKIPSVKAKDKEKSRKNAKSGKDDFPVLAEAIPDPCLLHGQLQAVTASNAWGRSLPVGTTVADGLKSLAPGEVMLLGTGDWSLCRKMLLPLLDRDATCPYNHCPVGGQYQPRLTPELLQQALYGFSEYWFTTRDVVAMDPAQFSAKMLEEASQALCDAPHSTLDTAIARINAGAFPPSASEKRVREQCFKAAWLDTLLFEGHGVPRDSKPGTVVPISSLEGAEVQWSLGALIVKITQKVKNNEAFCRSLAREEPIANALALAKEQFRKDEAERLTHPDKWGREALWHAGHYLLLGLLAFTTMVVIVGCCVAHERRKNLHTLRREWDL